MDDRIVGKPSGDHGGISFVDFLDEGIHDLPLTAGNLLSCGVLNYMKQPVKANLHLLFRYLIFHGSRRSSGALGVNKGKGIVKLYPFYHIDRLLKILRGLSGETDDNVCSNGNIGNLSPDLFCQGKVLLLGISSIHPGQDLCGTGLQRQMKMPADLFGFLHHLNQLVRQILGMRGHKADPLQSFDLLDLPEQF